MRRDEYERSYGRRSHVPPPLPSPQVDPRSRRSRTKMKCLISIGLILPALAAVIGVAAWAVSADVVMNSGGNRGSNRIENNLLQNYALENDNRPDIFRMNGDSPRLQPRQRETPTTSSTSTSTTTTSTTTTTTTTTTTPPPPPPAPQTLSPQEATDVNAILSKLISASGAASGGTGPRFVVVAPLPDNAEALHSGNPQSGIARVDHASANDRSPDDGARHSSNNNEDLAFSASSQSAKFVAAPKPPAANLTSRMANKEVSRRMSPQSHRHSHNNQPVVELSGFEPFDSMISESFANPSPMQQQHMPPPPEFGYKRGPPQGHYGSRNKPMQDQHMFRPDHHQFASNHAPTVLMSSPGGIGMKPIQQQLHHVESGPQLQAAESNRWGTIGFPPGGAYLHQPHKPPEGISVAISSPANSGTHVSAEPVSVIKSFFLPFLPRPRLNMNARVVFGVVLDKGMGLGGNKKEAHHIG